jgi:hypothetical protein
MIVSAIADAFGVLSFAFREVVVHSFSFDSVLDISSSSMKAASTHVLAVSEIDDSEDLVLMALSSSP